MKGWKLPYGLSLCSCLPLLCQDVYHECPKEFVAENMLVTQQSVAVAECYAGRET